MPAVPARDVAADRLAHTYEAAQARIDAELAHLLDDPLRWRRRARLAELSRLVASLATELDTYTRGWVQQELPMIYAAGAAAMGASGTHTWTMPHREAMQLVAATTYDLLLSATTHTKTTTKELVRAVTHDEVLQKLTTGETATKLGQRIATRLVAEHGIAGVTYKNGARHTIGDYGEMVARTQSALAYNGGALVQAREDGVHYVEVFDGAECGWTSHDDSDFANGSVRTVDEAATFSIAHPRCLRGFGPRPDLTLGDKAIAPPSTAPPVPPVARIPAAKAAHDVALATAKGGNRGALASRTPYVKDYANAVSLLKANEGFTITPAGVPVTSGFAVAIEGHSSVSDATRFFADRDHAQRVFEQFLTDQADELSKPGIHIGGWWDKEHGKVVLDPAHVFAPDQRAAAIAEGIARDQVAIYSLHENLEIATGGGGGYVPKPG